MTDFGTWTGVGVAPRLLTVTWLSPHLRVTFNEAMTKDATFLAAGSYILTTGTGVAVTVSSTVSGPGVNPTYIDLVLNKSLTIGTANYTMTVNSAIMDKASNIMDVSYSALVFNGNAVRATIIAIPFASNLNVLRIQYSVPVKQVSPSNADDALKPTNYSITGGVSISSVAHITSSCVVLSVVGQVINVDYVVTVSNVQDLSNNVVS